MSQQLMGGVAPGAGRTPAVRFARWAGVIYASAGILGLASTGLHDLTATSGAPLGAFEVNGLQSLLHLLVGVGLVSVSGTTPGAARGATMVLAAAFGVVGLLGLALVGTEANVLAVNTPTNVAHLATAVVGGICAAASSPRRTGRARTP